MAAVEPDNGAGGQEKEMKAADMATSADIAVESKLDTDNDVSNNKVDQEDKKDGEENKKNNPDKVEDGTSPANDNHDEVEISLESSVSKGAFQDNIPVTAQDQRSKAQTTQTNSINIVPRDLPARKQDKDLMKLHCLCIELGENQNRPSVLDDTRNQTTDSILQLLVTEDMSSIRSSDVLHSLFVDYLHLLPPKVISEVLSVLIAIVKKSVFHLESARGLLIPCINHLLSSEPGNKSRASIDSIPSNDDNHHSMSDVSSLASTASSVSLTKHFLREWINLLIAHSCDVEELKTILKFSEQDATLLSFIQQANIRQRNRPTAFFAFPGTKGSMISLPPFQKWPIQTGWSFSTWFFLEPKVCAQPYLFNFKTGKSGLGYSAHFTGNCLVLTSIRVKGKGVQHCVAYEFPSYKWIHCAITYHNKWRASEIKVYVNGQLSANIEMPWQVQTTELFDKCFIGGSGSLTSNDRSGELNSFCGQMSALYLFNEGLSPAQICAIHRLGPSYMGQFKYSNESHVNLPPQICKALYEEKLASTLFCLFTPVAVDSGTLCIQLAPFRSSTTQSAHNYFISAPHAALLGQTKAIITQPICSTLQSLGCSRSLLPLLDAFANKGDPEACSSLIGFLCDLLESSPHWFANEIVQNNGFVTVACSLANNARLLISDRLLDIFLNLTRTLLTTSSTVGDSLLLKHLMDNILLNPTLWIYADTKLQIKLYNYLATEFLHGTRQSSNKYTMSNSTIPNNVVSNSGSGSTYMAYNPTSSAASTLSSQNYPTDDLHKSTYYETGQTSVVTDLLFGEIRRVSTVLQTLHALKYHYWMVEERGITTKARNQKLRPNQEELAIIRTHLLMFTKELIVRANTTPADEIQGLLNYLSSCSHADNLLDVMEMLSSLLSEHPVAIVAALDQKQGIKVLFTLIGSKSERVRVRALRLLGSFLAQCTNKRKQDIMGPNNLFMLLCDRLRAYKPMTLDVYEALIDIMVEADGPKSRHDNDTTSSGRIDLSKKRIENSIVIKVIATLLHEANNNHQAKQHSVSLNDHATTYQSNSITYIKKIFINDLWNLLVSSKENRRTVLQMSVWQHWLINLVDSTIDNSQLVRDQVLAIFRILLYHAIRYEFGGWRVWIDTLAIIHTKVSYDEFCQQLNSDSATHSPHIFRDNSEREIGTSTSTSHKQSKNGNSPPADQVNQSPGKVTNDASPINSSKNESGDESKGTDVVDIGQDGQANIIVSSISERIPRESSGIQMDDDEESVEDSESKAVEETLNKITDQISDIVLSEETNKDQLIKPSSGEHFDSVDIAPSREYRMLKPKDSTTEGQQEQVESPNSEESTLTRQHSLTSIPLDDSVTTEDSRPDIKEAELTEISAAVADDNHRTEEAESQEEEEEEEEHSHHKAEHFVGAPGTQAQRAIASPAFRIPEFKWSNILIKLLNDLMFSIECDLYHWRCMAKCTNLDTPPFVPRSASATVNAQQSGSSTTASGPTVSRGSSSSSGTMVQIESILQRAENQIYIINVVHFVSQLADNIIIAAGGLLPLLADATGGTRSGGGANTPSSPAAAGSPNDTNSKPPTLSVCEGLTLPQANSLLYRLINMVDVVIFAASHINLAELEADKNTTSGGILRQCLRLACTVTVKNCLVVRSIHNKITSLGIGGEYNISSNDFPKDMFDSYQGCSLLSANGLFENSTISFENSDLIANVEFSPHQTPNTSSMPSLLPFQSTPIKDYNKLLQTIDISRIQACIYHDFSTESRQSQFLALSSLYFISVLMVSKYRDIIEPKQQKSRSKLSPRQSSNRKDSHSSHSLDSGFQNGSSISNIESNLLTFGKMQPNSTNNGPSSNQSNSLSVNSTSSALTDMLTTKLENTLDTVCPLLKSIMCDFCTFLSKTLIGSHGQDLVNKEADRTFRRANTSPVELVMLLCSQEWQNTLQKNAGLAFIELINEGRVLSHGMKDHIVRVAMEAEFILSRLRADDVAKHEHFSMALSETQSARLHEEVLINSLISSAARRDYVIYCKFKEQIQIQKVRNFKLDIWEDDDRRKRRFVIDSWDNSYQTFYSSWTDGSSSGLSPEIKSSITDTKRILELQQTIELGGIDDHCSPAGATTCHQRPESDTDTLHLNDNDKDDECGDEEEYQDDEDEQQAQMNDSNSPDSDFETRPHKNGHKLSGRSAKAEGSYNNDIDSNDNRIRQATNKAHNLYSTKSSHNHKEGDLDSDDIGVNDVKDNHVWDYEECSSVNDFTGSVIFAAECSLVWNIYTIPGVFQLTTHELYFEPNQNISDAIDMLKKPSATTSQQTEQTDVDGEHGSIRSTRSMQNEPNPSMSPSDKHHEQHQSQHVTFRKLDLKVLRYCDFLTCNGKILLNDIRAIFSRHYLLQPHALEIFLAQRTSVMFAFADADTVKRAVKYLPPVGVGIKYGVPQSRRASLMSARQLFAASNMTQKWQRREIGNFQYLIFLNTIAGRTYQDLNQYPVFPWILTNYESDELDLNLPSNFRDLSKPVGALNNKRRAEFIERYQSWDNPKVPAFHYGTHYSTAAFTLNWLCRLRGACNSAYLALQDGKYEEDTRMFWSIGDSWVSSLTGSQQNVKELIPEFFYLPEMFHSNLGLPEVEYPPWAKSAEQFVRIHRLALESELVSCQLHQWIDLIFGYKQRGPEAINAVNTFYYLTYQGNVNLNMIQEASLREAIETQIKHFGQTPSQLTTEPHPPRFSALHASPLVFSSTVDDINKVVKFPFNTSIVHISSCISNYIANMSSVVGGGDGASTGTVPNPNSASIPSSILTITSNNQYQIHKWQPNDQSGHPLTIDPQLDQSSSNSRRQLIDVDDLCSGISMKLQNYANIISKNNVARLEDIADEIQWTCAHYVVTLDGRYIIMGSFYDNSFRVFTTESGKLCQVIYGHRGPITCITRSEGNAAADFYLATGSQDCSLLLWTWNEKYAQVEGSGVSAVHNPLPKLTISGHHTPVLSAVICAELGLVISGSKNLILVNTTTSGENLLEIEVILPNLLDKISVENRGLHIGEGSIQRPQVKDKEKAILEASMLGNGNQALKFTKKTSETTNRPTRSPSVSSNASERFSHLKELCHSDYYITNLQLARELAFIVCIALPPPRKRSKIASDEFRKPSTTALLMTFNLKGSLINSTTVGQALNGPRLGDVCLLQTTRDGEHLILNDSPSSIQVYRTFDLQPIYAYNTNDIPNNINEDQNRIRSLTLLDHKFVLVGLENGKIIVYNADFKNLQ